MLPGLGVLFPLVEQGINIVRDMNYVFLLVATVKLVEKLDCAVKSLGLNYKPTGGRDATQ